VRDGRAERTSGRGDRRMRRSNKNDAPASPPLPDDRRVGGRALGCGAGSRRGRRSRALARVKGLLAVGRAGGGEERTSLVLWGLSLQTRRLAPCGGWIACCARAPLSISMGAHTRACWIGLGSRRGGPDGRRVACSDSSSFDLSSARGLSFGALVRGAMRATSARVARSAEGLERLGWFVCGLVCVCRCRADATEPMKKSQEARARPASQDSASAPTLKPLPLSFAISTTSQCRATSSRGTTLTSP
jgi:hypothetical protein